MRLSLPPPSASVRPRPPPPRPSLAVRALPTPSLADARAALSAAVASDPARGGTASSAVRGAVEEACLALERAGGGGEDPDLETYLPGRWRLVFTTAPDVAPLLAASSAAAKLSDAIPFLPPPPSVGAIYQQFAPPSDGRVANIITFAPVPPLLASLTATVAARYAIQSPRRLALTFERASLGRGVVSEGGAALIAPALLPRGTLQMKALQALQAGRLSVPLVGALPAFLAPLGAPLAAARRAAGAQYVISYADDATLIGRQSGVGGGGLFVFERVEEGAWKGGGDEGWE